MTRPGDYIRPERRVTCKRCGASNLGWYKTEAGRWILSNTVPSRDSDKATRDVRYIAPWSPHRCADTDAVREAAAEKEAKEARRRMEHADLERWMGL